MRSLTSTGKSEQIEPSVVPCRSNPAEAREVAGDWLVLRPGDDGYDDLGARAEGAPVEVERCSVCGLPFVTRGPERGVLVAPCGH